MDGWRTQRGQYHHQGVQGTRSHHRRPITGSWQPKLQTVPSWEKKFCFLVGSVPWRKLLDTKKYIHLYENVVQWNDSAGEEAFHNAKNRFWAEMNGLVCDISSPDPDAYIDKVDWDSKINEEILLDLEHESVPVEGSNDDNGVIIGNPLLLHPTFSCVGWGEAEEDFKKETIIEDGDRNNDDDNNTWESIYARNNGTTKDKSSWGHDEWDSNYNGWDDSYNVPATAKNKAAHAWGTWDMKSWNRESSGLNMSRYKTTRYHGDNRQMGRGGSGGRGGGRKREHFSCEQPFVDRHTSRQWNSNYCRPISHDISSKPGNQWG